VAREARQVGKNEVSQRISTHDQKVTLLWVGGAHGAFLRGRERSLRLAEGLSSHKKNYCRKAPGTKKK